MSAVNGNIEDAIASDNSTDGDQIHSVVDDINLKTEMYFVYWCCRT